VPTWLPFHISPYTEFASRPTWYDTPAAAIRSPSYVASMNIRPRHVAPSRVVIDTILSPSFFTPLLRSSHLSRWTGISNSFT
jgi:hypothetical protein